MVKPFNLVTFLLLLLFLCIFIVRLTIQHMLVYVLVFPLDSLLGCVDCLTYPLSPECLLASEANTVSKCNYNLWVCSHQVMLFMSSLFIIHVNCLWSKGFKTPNPEVTVSGLEL